MNEFINDQYIFMKDILNSLKYFNFIIKNMKFINE